MRYVCQICGYIYDDATEKMPFDEFPDNWKCPLCRAAKSDFKPEGREESVSGTDIWVCGTCGFVHIGNNPPELCPVCKVPAWKFQKIGGKEYEHKSLCRNKNGEKSGGGICRGITGKK